MENPIFKKIVFIKSIANLNERPELKLPEIAFAGRSNVGKSALLNTLWKRKNLAKTSSQPGKTRMINYFEIDRSFYFVDLPGYGYATTGKEIADAWKSLIENYFQNTAELRLVCLLIDSRHQEFSRDRQMIDWLSFQLIPFVIVLTKIDKISRSKLKLQVEYFQKKNPDYHIIPFSIKIKETHKALSDFIFNLLGEEQHIA